MKALLHFGYVRPCTTKAKAQVQSVILKFSESQADGNLKPMASFQSLSG